MGCGASKSKSRTRERRERVKLYRDAMLKQQRREFKSMGALAERNPRLMHTLDALVGLPYPTLAWNSEGSIIHANAAALDLLRHDEESLRVGNHILKVLGTDPMLEEYQAVHHTHVTTSDGAQIPVDLSVSVLAADEGIDSVGDIFLGTFDWWAHRRSSDGRGSSEDPCSAPASPLPVHSPLPLVHPGASTKSADVASPASPITPVLAQGKQLEDLEGLSDTGGSPVSLTRQMSNASSKLGRMASARSVRFDRGQGKLSDDTTMMLDSLQHPAMITTATGQIVHWNQGCERVFGPPLEEVVGHNLQMFIPSPYHRAHEKYLAENLPKPGKEARKARTEFMRNLHHVIARRVDSASQRRRMEEFKKTAGQKIPDEDLAEAEPRVPKNGPRYFPLQMMLTSCTFPHLDGVFWLMVCSVNTKLTLGQEQMMSHITEVPEHPSYLPAVRPTLDIGVKVSILGRSNVRNRSPIDLQKEADMIMEYEEEASECGTGDEDSENRITEIC